MGCHWELSPPLYGGYGGGMCCHGYYRVGLFVIVSEGRGGDVGRFRPFAAV